MHWRSESARGGHGDGAGVTRLLKQPNEDMLIESIGDEKAHGERHAIGSDDVRFGDDVIQYPR